MGDFLSIEDFYEFCKDILRFDFGFSSFSFGEKIGTVVLFPFFYFLAILGFIIFGAMRKF